MQTEKLIINLSPFYHSGCEEPFSWPDYCNATGSMAAPRRLFIDDMLLQHFFEEGMKVEAVNLLSYNDIHVATVARSVVTSTPHLYRN